MSAGPYLLNGLGACECTGLVAAPVAARNGVTKLSISRVTNSWSGCAIGCTIGSIKLNAPPNVNNI
ncbi:hypothetical protein TCA2_3842 [Paenibacillus sp. TCA20]|nr:hypothetical protein TCA2_3842 [Paenibacillus sp. TCA20]